MAEPHATGSALGLAALLTAIGGAAGEVLGPWAIVLFGGVVGSAIAIGHMETPTLRAAWWVFFRGVLLAVGFAGIVAAAVVPMMPVGGPLLLFAVAVAIGFRQLRLLNDLRALWPGSARRGDGSDG